jgi:hypothetical protein
LSEFEILPEFAKSRASEPPRYCTRGKHPTVVSRTCQVEFWFMSGRVPVIYQDVVPGGIARLMGGGRVAHPFSSVHLRNEGYFSCQRKSQEEAPVESHSSTNEGRATRPVFARVAEAVVRAIRQIDVYAIAS